MLIEIKKDTATIEAVNQVIKYIDWINEEYTYGDYSIIGAFIIVYEFSNQVIENRNRICIRKYTKVKIEDPLPLKLREMSD